MEKGENTKRKSIIGAFAMITALSIIFGACNIDANLTSEPIQTPQVSDESADNQEVESTENNGQQTQDINETLPPEPYWVQDYGNSKVKYVKSKYLSKNAKYYKGQVVVSVANIYEKSDNELQADTDDSNYFIEITYKMNSNCDISELKKNDKICIIGTVDETNSFFGNETVVLTNCYIMATGNEVEQYQQKIDKQEKKQKKYIKLQKEKEKQKKQKAAAKEKNSYIKKCKTYSYKDIQRKPKNYDGKYTKLVGTVIQVSEGWFDSVTLRVNDSSGNTWYINYSYSKGENKILENDKVTIYGKCTGTETYTTVLGASVTIPAIEAEYIN